MERLEMSVKRFTIDNDERSLEVEMADGTVHRQVDAFPPEAANLRLPQDFRRVTFEHATRALTLIPPEGEALVVEVYDNDDQMARRAGRPVIYLDQNQWIQLGRAVHASSKVPAGELSAAKELIRLALDERVILPLSSGHMIETSQTDRSWRRQLGPLMVRLSRGWLMRDPLRVRRAELRWMFSCHAKGTEHPVGDVITLDPAELSAEIIDPPVTDSELLPEFQQMLDTLAAVTSIFAVLIDDERLHSQEGAERSAAWASAHHDLARHLKLSGIPRDQYRHATLAVFLSDLSLEIAHSAHVSGMESSEFDAWLSGLADADLTQLPYVGRSRDVIHFRLCNANDRWKSNDLIDMLFLPCAAAYSDYVVGEKKTIDYLVRAERKRPGGAVLVSSLAALIDHLESAQLSAPASLV